ncbi:MAG TPA: hypothetical protein VJ300_09525 [Thermoplasmata archaeon]|nr:hypothetical protein [Thermoplasmata archaeon]
MDSIKSLARGGRRSYVASMAIVAALLALAFASGGAVAGRGGTRVYVVGTDPLCTIIPEVPPEFACPAISMADNGDTIAIDGTGTFNPTTRAAAGGGSFTHRNAAGAVVGSGTWTALRVLGFHSYGTQTLAGMLLEGGEVLLRVRLVAGGGAVMLDAILQIDCEIGKVPPGATEGFRLVVQAIDLNFNQEVQGLTVFIPAS